MEHKPGEGKASGGPSCCGMGGKSPAMIITVIVVLGLAAAYAYWFKGAVTTNKTTNAAASPTPAAESPTPTSTPEPVRTTKAERFSIGSITLDIPADVVTWDNPSLKDLLGESGMELVANRSFSNETTATMREKLAAQGTSTDATINAYWRVDVVELSNSEQQDLKAWVDQRWPKYEGAKVDVQKSTLKLGGRTALVHALSNAEIDMRQTVYFLQPKDKGNVVVVMSLQGTAKTHERLIDGMITSLQFN